MASRDTINCIKMVGQRLAPFVKLNGSPATFVRAAWASSKITIEDKTNQSAGVRTNSCNYQDKCERNSK